MFVQQAAVASQRFFCAQQREAILHLQRVLRHNSLVIQFPNIKNFGCTYHSQLTSRDQTASSLLTHATSKVVWKHFEACVKRLSKLHQIQYTPYGLKLTIRVTFRSKLGLETSCWSGLLRALTAGDEIRDNMPGTVAIANKPIKLLQHNSVTVCMQPPQHTSCRKVAEVFRFTSNCTWSIFKTYNPTEKLLQHNSATIFLRPF